MSIRMIRPFSVLPRELLPEILGLICHCCWAQVAPVCKQWAAVIEAYRVKMQNSIIAEIQDSTPPQTSRVLEDIISDYRPCYCGREVTEAEIVEKISESRESIPKLARIEAEITLKISNLLAHFNGPKPLNLRRRRPLQIRRLFRAVMARHEEAGWPPFILASPKVYPTPDGKWNYTVFKLLGWANLMPSMVALLLDEIIIVITSNPDYPDFGTLCAYLILDFVAGASPLFDRNILPSDKNARYYEQAIETINTDIVTKNLNIGELMAVRDIMLIAASADNLVTPLMMESVAKMKYQDSRNYILAKLAGAMPQNLIAEP